MHILLVDDDQFFQKFYAKKLTENGFTVDTASDGEEALAKVKAVKPVKVAPVKAIVEKQQPQKTVATAAQLRAIRTLARQAGTSPENVCQGQYGHGRVEELTVREASGLIDALKSNHAATRPVA